MRLARTSDDEPDFVGRLIRRPTCFALLVACLAPSASLVRAGERVPVQRPMPDDSIAAAGRELEAVNSNAANAANTTGTLPLPQIAVPALQQPADPAVAFGPTVVPNDPTKRDRSATWLVDAMMKPDDRKPGEHPRDFRDGRGDRTAANHVLGRSGNASESPDGMVSTASVAGESELNETPDRSPATPAADQAFNPLARYMAGWLAPQDYALLRRTLETPSSAPSRSADSASAAAGAVDVTSTAVVTDLLSGLGGTDKRGSEVAAKPADNPYLEALTLPVPPPPVQPPAATFVPESAPLSSAMPAPEPTRPVVPPFVRPISEDKYYKPLKRF